MSICTAHNTCFQEAVSHAETVCRDQGARLTPMRREVLELLWAGHVPSKAYDLLETVRRKHPAAKPPTVYRALDFLQAQGLVHKIQSLNAYIGCKGHHAHQYLICNQCGTVSDIHDSALSQRVHDMAAQKGFQVKHTVIELQGICGECAR